MAVTVMGFKRLLKDKKDQKCEVRTAEDWLRTLRKSKNPRDWITPMLSDLEVTVKMDIFRQAPKSIFNDKNGLKLLEAQVCSAGLFELTQYIRYIHYLVLYDTRHAREWCQSFIEVDIEGRWIVQREIYIREQIRAMHKALELPSSTTERSKIDAYENELERLNDKYWLHYRKSWKIKGNVPSGPLNWAIDAWRKDSAWYLHPCLKSDCAGQGGCCGRSCRCCEKPRDTNRELYNKGHCTTACPCCVRNRGVSDESLLDDKKDFVFDLRPVPRERTTYSQRIFRAYILGITVLDTLGCR